MSLVIVSGLKLSFGAKVLFGDESFSIGPSDRIGLVGANGTGKSTLLKVLVGLVQPDEGRLVMRRGSRVGYLPQDLQTLPSGTLLHSVLRQVPGRDALDARLALTEADLAKAQSTDEQMELAQALAELHEEKEHFEDHFGQHRAEQILSGLGFRQEELGQDSATLSGGWRMRAALAGLLLQDPDLLLLDEPTNHLDLPTLTWFDGFLSRSKKALVLISHDRAFLNRHIGRVISLEPEGLRSWTGDYEEYQRQRAEEAERLLAQAEKVATRRAQLEAFVNRFRAKASKARQAQSKMKALERLDSVAVHQHRDSLSFQFPTPPPSGREVARLSGVCKAFGTKVVYDGLDAQVLRGQRIAVVGLNGAGKTTLLKILAGEMKPDAGEVRLGHNVSLGYYAQHHAETLDRERTILDEMRALVPNASQAFIRSALGAFLFSGDDVDKRIGVLSGGERARVALARLLLKPANLMVMDEPTNHLDLDSSEALIEALEGYQGTLVFVSHNRSFLNALATVVWDVRGGKVIPYPGNLDEYLSHLEQEVSQQHRGEVGATPLGGESNKDRRRAQAEARQLRSQQFAPLKKEIAALEARIAHLEGEQKARELQLAQAEFVADYPRARPVMEAHRTDAQELEQLLTRWALVQEALEKA